jgi:hypothetical protein
MTFNILSPSKKFSQLIAQSWLDGERYSFDKKFLVEKGIFSEQEAQSIHQIEVREVPPEHNLVGTITLLEDGQLELYIPYPQLPTDVENPPTPEQLTSWINSDVNSEPYGPWEHFSPWIPYTTC